MPTTKGQIKASRYNKSNKPTIGKGVPPSSFGEDGDLTFRVVGNDKMLMIKANGEWHGVKVGESFNKVEREIDSVRKSLGHTNNIKQLDSLSAQNQIKSSTIVLNDFSGKTEPSSAPSNTGLLYVKDDVLYFIDDAPTTRQLSGSPKYWHQIIGGYKVNNASTTTYYTFYRNWYENWNNSDSSPSSISDSDSYATFFIAPRAGTVTNMKVQGYALDTGAADPFKFYIYKGAMSNNSDSVSLTSMVNSGTITPSASGKTFSHTVDFSSSNTFAEDDCLYVWLKKDSNTGNQDLYFTININGEYS